ncbi:phosphotransferase [Erythrobacter sp.]|nr:phosphotransferase [Erythrobacter sp.]
MARRTSTAFGIEPASRLTLLGYRENAVFRLDGANGDRVALRLHQPGLHTRSEIASEFAFMKRLRSCGLETPRERCSMSGESVIEACDPETGEARYATALEWVDGHVPSSSNMIEAYRQVGAIAAKIHLAGQDWERPSNFSRWTINADTGFGETGLWGDYHRVDKLALAQITLLDRAGDLVLARLKNFGETSDRFGLIHGDLMLENLLVAERQVTIIDFDDCGFGWYLYDLATALFAHASSDTYVPLRDAWIEGYRRHRALGHDEIAMIDTFTMMRVLGLMGWQARFPNHPVTRELGDWMVGHAVAYAAAYVGRS